MRALVFDPVAPQGLRLGEVPDPTPTASQVLVRVEAVSFNFGEVVYLSELVQPGEVGGWDAAGVVVRAAADGSGPVVGARVVTFEWAGAWAELRAVETSQLAVVPDGVDLGAAAALPVAGVTALQAVRRLGDVAGKRVLVTGASGGVGRYAVQLAARAGAHVVASVGSPARGDGLEEIGAAEVVVGLEGVEESVSGIVETVGGPQLAEALKLVRSGGVVQWVGVASRQPTPLSVEHVGYRGWRLESFLLGMPVGADLAELVGLLATGGLDPQIGWRGSWERADEAVTALLARQVAGKAVLDL